MKTKLIIAILCFLSLISCESDIDFTDLTSKRNYMMEMTVFFDSTSSDDSFDFDLIDYQTNGLNEFVSFPRSIGFDHSDDSQITVYIPVKGYKKVGVKLIPKENIKGFRFTMREIDYSIFYNPYIVEIEEPANGSKTIYYDFETKSIIRE